MKIISIFILLLWQFNCLAQTKINYFSPISYKSPDQVTGLKIWYDMTDNSTISQTAGTLTQLRDKSGNANHSNPTSTARGTITTDGTLGTQVLTLNGTSNYLPLTTEISNASFSVFFVIKNTNIANTKYIASSTTNSDLIQSTLGQQGIVNTTDGVLNFYKDDSILDYTVLSIRKSSGSILRIQYNGRDQHRAGTTVSTTAQYIGQLFRSNSGFYMPGSFAGFVYYDNYLSDSDSNQIIKYLFNHHGLGSVSSKLILFGDSITEGTSGTSSYANSWGPKLGVLLSKRICNGGIGGTTLQNSGSTTNNGYDRYLTQLKEYPYNDSYIIAYGTNDVGGVATGGSASNFQSQLDEIVLNLLKNGVSSTRIYLVSPPYRLNDGSSATNQSYGAAVQAVATKYSCTFIDMYSATKNGGGNSLMADGLHYTDAGNTFIASIYYSLIKF